MKLSDKIKRIFQKNYYKDRSVIPLTLEVDPTQNRGSFELSLVYYYEGREKENEELLIRVSQSFNPNASPEYWADLIRAFNFGIVDKSVLNVQLKNGQIMNVEQFTASEMIDQELDARFYELKLFSVFDAKNDNTELTGLLSDIASQVYGIEFSRNPYEPCSIEQTPDFFARDYSKGRLIDSAGHYYHPDPFTPQHSVVVANIAQIASPLTHNAFVNMLQTLDPAVAKLGLSLRRRFSGFNVSYTLENQAPNLSMMHAELFVPRSEFYDRVDRIWECYSAVSGFKTKDLKRTL